MDFMSARLEGFLEKEITPLAGDFVNFTLPTKMQRRLDRRIETRRNFFAACSCKCKSGGYCYDSGSESLIFCL